MGAESASALTARLVKSLSTAAATMATPAPPSLSAVADEVLGGRGSSSWLGFTARLIVAILHLVSSLLYWTIRLVTITIPTVLFTLFSRSWTVTMNATTLYGTPWIECLG